MTEPLKPLRERVIELYEPPFRYEQGYIFDAKGNMVSDNTVDGQDALQRIRGWGRLGYLPEGAKLQNEAGAMIAEALTEFWNRRVPTSEHELVAILDEAGLGGVDCYASFIITREKLQKLVQVARASARSTDQFAAADAELHAVLPPNVSHEVLETMPPLPKEWSAQVVCDKVLAYGKSKVSPQMALAIGIINFLTEYQKTLAPSAGSAGQADEPVAEVRAGARGIAADKAIFALRSVQDLPDGTKLYAGQAVRIEPWPDYGYGGLPDAPQAVDQQARRLALEEAVRELERRSTESIKGACGEMTEGELRAVRAALSWKTNVIRSLAHPETQQVKP